MRDETVYQIAQQLKGEINQIVQFVQNLQQAVRLDSTGKELRLLSVQQLLIKKGIITEAEMTEQTGEEMQKEAEAQAAKAKAPEIVPATPAQTAQVEATKDAPVISPQA